MHPQNPSEPTSAPTTEAIREAWATDEQGHRYASEAERFDRWLAAHDAEVRDAERERIASAIEADARVRPLAGHDGIRDAARIARGDR